MSKKTRSDAFESQLSELQFLELRDGLLNRKFASYAEAISWLSVECGVSPAQSAMSRFWRDHCVPVVADQRKEAAARAEAIGDAMRESPVNWDDATIEKAKQRYFELVDRGDQDAKELSDIIHALVKERKQSLDEKKFDELVVKARKADETSAKAKALKEGGGLSPETLEVIEKQLKLL